MPSPARIRFREVSSTTTDKSRKAPVIAVTVEVEEAPQWTDLDRILYFNLSYHVRGAVNTLQSALLSLFSTVMWGELDIPDRGKERFTDYSRWRLRTDNGGMHVWSYLQEDRQLAEWPQTDVDRYWLGLPVVRAYLRVEMNCKRVMLTRNTVQDAPTLPTPSTPLEAARNGLTFYKRLQTDDGHWPGEYGGPLFLMPGLVIGSYVTGMTFTLEERKEMIRYLMNRAHPDDGGWGL